MSEPEEQAPLVDDVVAMPVAKSCTSCHSSKPAAAFSGFATCDQCRTKKRKRWGNKQAELKHRSDLGPNVVAVLTSLKKAEDVRTNHVQYQGSNEMLMRQQVMTQQVENDFLRSLLIAGDAKLNQMQLLLQSQAQENVLLHAEKSQLLRLREDCTCLNGPNAPPHRLAPGEAPSGRHYMPQYVHIDHNHPPPHQPVPHNQPPSHRSVPVEHPQPAVGFNGLNAPTQYKHTPGGSLLDYTFDKILKEDSSGSVEWCNSGPLTGSGQGSNGTPLEDQQSSESLFSIDYAFSLLQEPLSSDSAPYVGCGNGSGASSMETICETPGYTPAVGFVGLTKNSYVRSLDYGIWFEDPELEQSFQQQMTRQRRLGMFVAWGVLAVALNMGDLLVSGLFPDDLGTHLFPESDIADQILRTSSVLAGLLFLGCMKLWAEGMSDSDLNRVRYFGEMWCYLGGLSSLWFIINKCYFGGSAAAAEDWVVICLKNCARTIVFSWSELNPIGAALNVVPLWLALLFVPDVTLVFRIRVAIIGAFMAAVATMVYKNNREMFVNQVRLQHAHLVTAELKRERSSNPCQDNTRQVDGMSLDEKSEIIANGREDRGSNV